MDINLNTITLIDLFGFLAKTFFCFKSQSVIGNTEIIGRITELLFALKKCYLT